MWGRREVALKEAKGFTRTVGGGVKGLSRAVGKAKREGEIVG